MSDLPRQALHEDWKLDDPAGQGVEAVRPIRDDIKLRVAELLAELIRADRLDAAKLTRPVVFDPFAIALDGGRRVGKTVSSPIFWMMP